MNENKILSSYTVKNKVWEDLQNFFKNYNSILIIGGNNGYEAVKQDLLASLSEADTSFEYIYYGGECSWSNVDKIKSKTKGHQAILAIGGGKVLDTGKAVGEMSDLDVITIPTIPATCAAITALSVIYDDSGSFSQLFYLKKPPVKTFVDLTTLAKSPERYLKAGMGDTLAKYYEVDSLTKGVHLNDSSKQGVELSHACKNSILEFGTTAYESNFSGYVSPAFEEVVTTNIITTGLVSCLVDEEYNGAIAHSVAMGLTIIDGFEEEVLHGEAVAYGILIQMLLQENIEEYNRLKDFYYKLGLPISLNELPLEDKIRTYKDSILKKIMTGPNVEVFPFLTQENLLTTMEL